MQTMIHLISTPRPGLTFQLRECFSQPPQKSGLLLQLRHRHQLVVDRRLLLDLLHGLLQVAEMEQTDGLNTRDSSATL